MRPLHRVFYFVADSMVVVRAAQGKGQAITARGGMDRVRMGQYGLRRGRETRRGIGAMARGKRRETPKRPFEAQGKHGAFPPHNPERRDGRRRYRASGNNGLRVVN
jgi:hypothetical protein